MLSAMSESRRQGNQVRMVVDRQVVQQRGKVEQQSITRSSRVENTFESNGLSSWMDSGQSHGLDVNIKVIFRKIKINL